MTGDFLYNDGKIRISYLEKSPEDHNLFIRDSYGCVSRFLLQRGILEELAKTPPKDLKNKLNAIDPVFHDFAMRSFWPTKSPIAVTAGNMDIFYRDLGFALTQARITELERLFTEATLRESY